MTSADDKKKRELAAFHKFIQLSGLSVILDSIENGDPDKHEPDILCEIEGEGPMAFELTEFAGIAKEIDRLLKCQEDAVGNFIWAGEVMHILGNKFTKRYERSRPIDLICYTDGRIFLPPDVLIPQMHGYLEHIQQHGQFLPGFDKNPRPEFYLRDGQEWMRFEMDHSATYDGLATDAHKEEYDKEYKMFKAGKRPSAPPTRAPNKNQFRAVWFMSVVPGEEYCEQIV